MSDDSDISSGNRAKRTKVESSVSFHEQDDDEALSQLGVVEWTTYYCFTNYIEAIPLTAGIAGGDIDGDQLEEFPELPVISDYAMLYSIDCLSEDHARQVASATQFVELTPDILTEGEVATRKQVLAALLNNDHMYTIYILVGPDNEDYFFPIFQEYSANDWVKIEVRPPADDAVATSVGDTLLGNLAGDVYFVMGAASPTADSGIETEIRIPDQKIAEVESRWLSEFVSFNHLTDVGTDGPTPDDAPPVVPPVPIFPVDSFLNTLQEFPPAELPDRIVHDTDAIDGLDTESFEFLEPGYWVHQATGIFTIPYGNCWVDRDGSCYRLYSDNVTIPTRIVFFRSDLDGDIPPQHPDYAMRTGIDLGIDIPSWDMDSFQFTPQVVAVF